MREIVQTLFIFFRSASLLCHVILHSFLISFQHYKSSSAVSSDDVLSEWDKGEKERILRGLEAILAEEDEFDEAELFLEPVDLKKVLDYCEAVPFPTSISTIAEKLRNGFYR